VGNRSLIAGSVGRPGIRCKSGVREASQGWKAELKAKAGDKLTS
jgi:hypothetical protein